jgi:uncharacterized integral membrane protein (TIGR00698 family)
MTIENHDATTEGERLDTRKRAPQILRLAPGLGLVLVIASAATYLGSLLPVVGAPVFGIVMGAIIAGFTRPGTIIDVGAKFAGKRILQMSIVLLGSGLSLTAVLAVGVSSLPVMLGTLAVALLGAWGVGKLLKVSDDIRTLIGVGTGICGASAIAATTAVIGAADAEVAYAIGTIFTFNIAAVLLYPTIGHLIGLSQHAFGLWAGTAINDTSSVVAAAYTYGPTAGAYGVVVKLTRTLMIIPISITLATVKARRAATVAPEGERKTPRLPWSKIFPLFIIGFLAASAMDSLGLVPPALHPTLSSISVFLITMALAGIGLSTRLSTLRQAGHRPLLLGGILWAMVGATSLLIQLLTGTL